MCLYFVLKSIFFTCFCIIHIYTGHPLGGASLSLYHEHNGQFYIYLSALYNVYQYIQCTDVMVHSHIYYRWSLNDVIGNSLQFHTNGPPWCHVGFGLVSQFPFLWKPSSCTGNTELKTPTLLMLLDIIIYLILWV